MTISAVKWHECTQLERPGQGEHVLTVDDTGDVSIMFWCDDVCAWDDPCYGWATRNIVAWARLPLYIPTVEKMVERSTIDNADVWQAMADAKEESK